LLVSENTIRLTDIYTLDT